MAHASIAALLLECDGLDRVGVKASRGATTAQFLATASLEHPSYVGDRSRSGCVRLSFCARSCNDGMLD